MFINWKMERKNVQKLKFSVQSYIMSQPSSKITFLDILPLTSTKAEKNCVCAVFSSGFYCPSICLLKPQEINIPEIIYTTCTKIMEYSREMWPDQFPSERLFTHWHRLNRFWRIPCTSIIFDWAIAIHSCYIYIDTLYSLLFTCRSWVSDSYLVLRVEFLGFDLIYKDSCVSSLYMFHYTFWISFAMSRLRCNIDVIRPIDRLQLKSVC